MVLCSITVLLWRYQVGNKKGLPYIYYSVMKVRYPWKCISLVFIKQTICINSAYLKPLLFSDGKMVCHKLHNPSRMALPLDASSLDWIPIM